MTTLARTIWLGVVSLVLVSAAPRVIQGQTPADRRGALGFAEAPGEDAGRVLAEISEYGRNELHRHPELVFTEVATPSALPEEATRATPVTFGPFTPDRSGFREVTVYLGRTEVPPEERGLADQADVRLALATVDHGGRRQWWQFGPKPGSYGPDVFRISDAPTTAERIDFAVDSTTALIRLDYVSTVMGASTSGAEWSQLLVDLRGTTPGVLAAFEAWHVEGGGACGVWDNQYTDDHRIGCQWDPSQGDFLCSDRTTRVETMWGPRRLERRFWLESGEAYYASLPGQPETLIDFSTRLDRDPEATHVAELPQTGRTHHLATGARPDGTTFRLFGAPGTGWRFDARFMVVRHGPDGSATEVPLRSALRLPEYRGNEYYGEPDRGNEVPEHTADFTTSFMGNVQDASLYRIVVREAGGTGVYLVAVALVDGRVTLDTLLVATEAESYDRCAQSTVPATATRMDVGATPLPMDIDVEPTHWRGFLNDEEEPGELPPLLTFDDGFEGRACAWKGRVTWQPATGFVVERLGEQCDAFPRSVSIDADGNLVVSAAFLETGERGAQVPYLGLGQQGGDTVVLLPDPDFDVRIWLELMRHLSPAGAAVALNPRARETGDDAAIVRALADDIQAVVDAVRATRVLVVAHGLSAPYAIEWVKAHPTLAAGLLLIPTPEQSWQISGRIRALTGTDEDRQAFMNEIVPGFPAAPAAKYMVDRSGYLEVAWLRTLAALLSYRSYDTFVHWNGPRIWSSWFSGARLPVVEASGIGGFVPMVDPDAKVLAAIDRIVAAVFGGNPGKP